MNQTSSKQSLVIGALSGALVLSVGAATFFYLQPKSQPQEIVKPAAVEAPKAVQLPSNATALHDMFGVTDPSGKIKTAYDKLTSLWFEQSFKDGDDNLHVKFYKTQSLDEEGKPMDSHATSVDVGAITYKQIAGQWQVISKQTKFGEFGQWGDAPEAKARILQLSPGVVALMVDDGNGMGGYNVEGKTLIAFSKGSWRDVGFVETGNDNSGACDETPPLAGEEWVIGPCYSSKGIISVATGSTSEYPDLLVTRTGTQQNEHGGPIVPAENVTYIFKDGKYTNPAEPQI